MDFGHVGMLLDEEECKMKESKGKESLQKRVEQVKKLNRLRQMVDLKRCGMEYGMFELGEGNSGKGVSSVNREMRV
jgi:hypothetical protein